MRNSVKFSIAALSLAIGTSACRDANADNNVAQAELKRDLEMAASATISLAAPKIDSALLKFEAQPASTPQASRVVRKSPGNRVVHSHAPTVRAAPVVEVAAVDESELTETVAEAAAPESAEPVAVAPRPTPVGDYGTGSGIFGGGSGGGVVIRGGGVDGDNCELHRRGGRRGGPPYIPQTAGPTAVSFPRRPGTSIGGGLGAGRHIPDMGGRSRVSGVSSGMQGVSRPSMGRRGR